jgi:hypothetical protein
METRYLYAKWDENLEKEELYAFIAFKLFTRSLGLEYYMSTSVVLKSLIGPSM